MKKLTSLISPNALPFVSKPYVALIDLTKHCNLKCSYCYGLNAERGGDLSGDQFISILRGLKAFGVKRIGLSGGEALLHPDAEQILQAAYELDLSVGLNSNGILVPQHIESLKRLGNLTISLDGASAEVHDRCRGKGAFDKAMKGLEAAHEAGIELHLAMTLGSHNYHEVENVLDIADRFDAQVLISPVYEEIFTGDIQQQAVPGDYLEETLKKVVELKRQGRPVFFSEQTYDALKIWPYGTGNTSGKKVKGHPKCLQGRKMIFIDNKGFMFPCSVVAESTGGVDCLEHGVEKAYAMLPDTGCQSCRWACFIEYNFLLNLSPGIVWETIKRIL